jgi:hypothetical protein
VIWSVASGFSTAEALAKVVSRTRKTRALAMVFFGRLFENDVFSSSVAASSSLVWLLALVATPGVMMSGSQMFSWAHLRALPFEVQDRTLLVSQGFHIDFVIVIAGLVTMLVWSSLTPDRRDAHVLGPLPVLLREQALGRLLALLKFFGLFIVAVSVPTAVVFTFVSTGAENILEVPQRAAGHVIAATCAGGFVFFTLVNTQLVLAALFGPRAIRFVTLPLQMAALVGMIAALALTDTFSRAMLERGLAGGPMVMWNPAAWFLGLYRWVAGDPRPIFALLAWRGALAALFIFTTTVVLYPLAYGRCLRNVIDSEGRRTGRLSRVWACLGAWVLRPLLRTPLQRGLAAYMLATLGRSQTHRFIIGSYAGIALLLAFPLSGRLLQVPTTGAMRYAWFSVPLGIVFWLVCGVRVAIMMPIEPSANWIFKITEPVDKRRVLTAVVTVMAAVTCVPVAAAFGGVAAMLGELRLGATVFVIVALAGLCLIEVLTLTLKTVPFTCTYLPGQLRLRVFWPLYFFLWLQFTFTLANWALWALQSRRQTLQLAAFLLFVWIALRGWHMVRARHIRAFVYDEQPPALVNTMDLATSLRQI